MTRRLMTTAVSSMLALVTPHAVAATLEVPAAYPLIQEAIDVALPGDTVLVGPGTYFENLDFGGKDLLLLSAEGARVTTIDGGGLGSVITCDDGETNGTLIEGFTIQNGAGTPWGSAGLAGGGIFCLGSCPRIRKNRILSNSADLGGGVALIGSFDGEVSENDFIGNEASERGGALYGDWAVLTFEQNRFAGNSAGSLGGAAFLNSVQATMLRCEYQGNSTPGMGGAIFLDQNTPSPTITVLHCTFVSNSAGAGGAYFYNSWFPQNPHPFRNSVFWANVASAGEPQIGYTPVFGVTGPDVQYCLVEGGYPGTGNFSADPLFVDLANEDLHLRLDSPCVDAGDPVGPPDPDGSEPDLGRYCCPTPLFERADCDLTGVINVVDAVTLLAHLFQGAIVPCPDACDFDDDGIVALNDPVQVLAFLFTSGPPAASPVGACGQDHTPDALTCSGSLSCP